MSHLLHDYTSLTIWPPFGRVNSTFTLCEGFDLLVPFSHFSIISQVHKCSFSFSQFTIKHFAKVSNEFLFTIRSNPNSLLFWTKLSWFLLSLLKNQTSASDVSLYLKKYVNSTFIILFRLVFYFPFFPFFFLYYMVYPFLSSSTRHILCDFQVLSQESLIPCGQIAVIFSLCLYSHWHLITFLEHMLCLSN